MIEEIMMGGKVYAQRLSGKVIKFKEDDRNIDRYYLNYLADDVNKVNFIKQTPDEYNNGFINNQMPCLILGVMRDHMGEKYIGMMIRYGTIFWYKYNDLKDRINNATVIVGGVKSTAISLLSRIYATLCGRVVC